MLSQQLMELLRCPMNPSDTRLREEQNALVCEQCELRFKIKDGFPILVAEEAELPANCESLSDLPCQRSKAPTGK